MSPISIALYEAHYNAAFRKNASTAILITAYEANGEDLIKAVAAALMSAGGRHAPLRNAYDCVKQWEMEYRIGRDPIIRDEKVWGFGSSFAKKKPDAMLHALSSREDMSRFRSLGENITNQIKKTRDLDLYPNLAYWTASCAIAQDMPYSYCEEMFLKARIDAWINILKGK